MRKFNKILMATVSVLLSLVLVSTCLVSGVFAKYTTKKARTMTVGFEAFGVTLSMDLSDAIKSAGGAITNKASKGITFEASVSALAMAPGDAFYDAIKVCITGTPNVPVEVKMTCKIVYPDGVDADKNGVADNGNAYVFDKSITGQSNNSCFMPLGFIVKTPTGNTYDQGSPICFPWHQKKSNLVTEAVMRNLASEVFGSTYSNKLEDSTNNTDGSGMWHYEKTYGPTLTNREFPNTMSEFYIGFYWPFEFGSDADEGLSKDTSAPTLTIAKHNDMATALATKAANGENVAISFVYTVSITQAG